MLFPAGDLFDQVTAFACGFIGLDAGIVRREIDDIHGSTATGLGASQMLMLERLIDGLIEKGAKFLTMEDAARTYLERERIGRD